MRADFHVHSKASDGDFLLDELVLRAKENNLQYFDMDSDAHIVRGLEAVLRILVNGKTTEEINALDIDGIFNELGLAEHLSPTRRNGFAGMVAKIKQVIA